MVSFAFLTTTVLKTLILTNEAEQIVLLLVKITLSVSVNRWHYVDANFKYVLFLFKTLPPCYSEITYPSFASFFLLHSFFPTFPHFSQSVWPHLYSYTFIHLFPSSWLVAILFWCRAVRAVAFITSSLVRVFCLREINYPFETISHPLLSWSCTFEHQGKTPYILL